MKKVFRVIFAFVVGVIVVFVIQFLLTKLWNLSGISWGPGNLPHELNQKIGMLTSAFIAGTLGPFVAVLISRKKSTLLVILFLIIGLSIDMYAALGPLKILALWFKVVWVVSVPLQVWSGVQLAGLFLDRRNGN